MADKRKVGWYLDVSLVARAQEVAQNKGNTTPQLIEKYLKDGLSKEKNITISERVFYQTGVLDSNITGLLSTFGVKVEGSPEHKLYILGAIINKKPRVQTEIDKNKQTIYSLFSIINDIKDIDRVKYDDFMSVLAKYPRIKAELRKCEL